MNPPALTHEVSIAGHFKFSIPEAAIFELAEEGETGVLRLSSDHEPLYLKRYHLQYPYSTTQPTLENEANRFLNEGILPICGKIIGSSIETGAVNGTNYAQLVAAISGSHWWLARLVSKPELNTYYLLHCHGDQAYLTLAIAVLSEFYILE